VNWACCWAWTASPQTPEAPCILTGLHELRRERHVWYDGIRPAGLIPLLSARSGNNLSTPPAAAVLARRVIPNDPVLIGKHAEDIVKGDVLVEGFEEE